MNRKNIVRPLMVFCVALASLLVVGIVTTQFGSTHEKSIALARPVFLDVAHASEESLSSELGDKLDQEAGISAYYKSPTAINLNVVRGQFRTIEKETSDYIIGSVAVPDYLEHYDTHVYINKNGWMLAYYLKQDAIAKIVDVKSQDINTTNLKNVLAAIAGVAGSPFSDVNYYDFRYPNATNILLVAENLSDGNDFSIELPSGYGYAELSWSLAGYGYPNYFRIDGTNMTSDYDAAGTAYGTLSISQLLPGSSHTIAVDDYGVLVVAFQVP